MALLKKLCLLLLGLVAILLGIGLVLTNPDTITIDFFGRELGPLPRGLWLLAALFAGCLMGVLASLPMLLRLRRRVHVLNQQLIKLRVAPARAKNKTE
ncbi:LapA family protein [uncultured Porticoccus sp.]|uniref:LapA family protein n=1 Tax=uncultured Porticoccus sp. TaxID=1256050 RepID=UPI0030D776F4